MWQAVFIDKCGAPSPIPDIIGRSSFEKQQVIFTIKQTKMGNTL